MIENTFGILVARWRILRNSLHLLPENAEKVVLACIALHNFIMLNDQTRYCPPHYVDWEDENNVVHEGAWRSDSQPLPGFRSLRSSNSPRTAIQIRNTLAEYFVNEGSVAFQYR